ncbi:MAG: phenylalanine--tRNA ligase subunit alpha [Actinobacteria bacterium]|nr:phenylalanine--tRNA ligase subunit alpha [Actinomycetota bacterium]
MSTDPVLIDQGAIESIKATAIAAINDAVSLDQLKDVRIAHVGDRSPIAKANQSLGQVPLEQRAALGKIIGTARANINQAYDDREKALIALRDTKALTEERVDVSLPTNRKLRGALHPLTILSFEISDFFIGLGYSVQEGPELESSWLNFDALNIPEDHPARTMQDTFFIRPLESGLVMRTHTSPVQIRTMLENEPPIYVICPGRTYRADELDATHTPVFNQVEGLVIDKGITMADLKGTLDLFAAKMFGPDVTTRIRPSFFPFTEPSAEVDFFYNGRWVEWGGCGMVNPKVLRACGIDADIYSGFAFGMGLERTLMVRHGITDMHDIVEGDVRFSRQFGTGIR